MRLKKREITSREIIDNFIMECSVVRIGMISQGEPYVVPLSFVYKDGSIYFHCAFEGRKAEAMKKSPVVCLEFDAMHGVSVESQTAYYTSVIAWGEAVSVSDMEKKREILQDLCVKYLKESTVITDSMTGRTEIIAVHLDKVTGKERKG